MSDDINRAAWMWWLAFTTQDSKNFKGIWELNKEVPLDTQERYLEIVNEECRALDAKEGGTKYIDCIPPEYRLLAR